MASSTDAALSPEDQALLERVATRIVELRLEVAAILALETGRPLSVLAGQTLYFLEPIVTSLFTIPDYRRFAGLVERRETLAALLRLIEDKADVAHRERRERADAKRAAKRAARAGDASPGAR